MNSTRRSTRARTRTTTASPRPMLKLVGGTEPDRTTRIDAVRKRIRAGYYDRRDIKETLARAVIDALRDED